MSYVVGDVTAADVESGAKAVSEGASAAASLVETANTLFKSFAPPPKKKKKKKKGKATTAATPKPTTLTQPPPPPPPPAKSTSPLLILGGVAALGIGAVLLMKKRK